MQTKALAAAAVLLGLLPSASLAQEAKEPRRVRIGLGAQVTPSYPGADEVRFGPYVNVDVARGDTPFGFEAQDESIAFPVINTSGVGIGPSINIQGSRTNSDVGTPIGKVKPGEDEAGDGGPGGALSREPGREGWTEHGIRLSRSAPTPRSR